MIWILAVIVVICIIGWLDWYVDKHPGRFRDD